MGPTGHWNLVYSWTYSSEQNLPHLPFIPPMYSIVHSYCRWLGRNSYIDLYHLDSKDIITGRWAKHTLHCKSSNHTVCSYVSLVLHLTTTFTPEGITALQLRQTPIVSFNDTGRSKMKNCKEQLLIETASSDKCTMDGIFKIDFKNSDKYI